MAASLEVTRVISSVNEAARHPRGSTLCATASRRQRDTRLLPDVGSTCDGCMVNALRVSAALHSAAQGR